jgi:ribosomal protein S18 acetylase RimI-like enzyme
MMERWTRAEPYAIRWDGELAGVVTVDRHEGEISIEELYLLPPFQRHGIGATVLRAVLDAAALRRQAVTLQCHKWNEGAIRFYRWHGFVATGSTQTHVLFRAEWR